MSRLLDLRLFIVVLVTIVMGHFLVNRRVEWSENLNQAFSQAWGFLGEGNRDAGVASVAEDPNNNNREGEEDADGRGAAAAAGVQNVWGEESFQQDDDQTCAGSGSELNQEESQPREN